MKLATSVLGLNALKPTTERRSSGSKSPGEISSVSHPFQRKTSSSNQRIRYVIKDRMLNRPSFWLVVLGGRMTSRGL